MHDCVGAVLRFDFEGTFVRQIPQVNAPLDFGLHDVVVYTFAEVGVRE
jgi:hypothetical protein